ncbi:hypothetical protein OAG1_12550 [Agarivorans sp. OAG1]|nr:hypothetical protein OAG1_12550 [Agarivorans sp. OAG1]
MIPDTEVEPETVTVLLANALVANNIEAALNAVINLVFITFLFAIKNNNQFV